MIDLSGKTVLLTGASQGIGAATAPILDACGAQVVMHYSASRNAAEAVATRMTNSPILVQSDLSEPGAGRRLVGEVLGQVENLDVVVNNAGVMVRSTIGDSADAWDAAWAHTLQVNLLALADICREAILHFTAKDGGAIINVASRAAHRGDDPSAMHYAASKGAVVAFTKSIARGFGPQGVLAYSIAPGWVSTDRVAPFLRENPDALRDLPLGRAVPPDEIGNTIAFLASGLARHASGSTIDVNGATYVR